MQSDATKVRTTQLLTVVVVASKQAEQYAVRAPRAIMNHDLRSLQNTGVGAIPFQLTGLMARRSIDDDKIKEVDVTPQRAKLEITRSNSLTDDATTLTTTQSSPVIA